MYYELATGVQRVKSKTKMLILAALFSLITLIGASTVTISVRADPSDQGACRQAVGDAFVAASSEGTRGDFMSDTIFGNEPNIEPFAPGGPEEQEPGTQAGTVVPSQSPGPFSTSSGSFSPPRNDDPRFTGGDLQAIVGTLCS